MIAWTRRLPRLARLFERYGRADAVRGRAMTLLGTALLADGLVGLENPLEGRRDHRPGIIGAFLAVIVGIVFLVSISAIARSSQPYAGGETADGTVVAVRQVAIPSNARAQRCSARVRYTVGGRQFTVPSGSTSTSLCSARGTSVTVSYPVDRPGAGRPQFSENSLLLTVGRVVAWILLIIGAVTAVLRAAEIVVGVVMLIRGRRLTRDAAPIAVDSVMTDLESAWRG